MNYGYSVLEKIHKGYFDEADIKVEGIPNEFKEKVNLGLLCNDFLGNLLFVMKLNDNEYVFQLLESYISNSSCSEKEYRDMVLQYIGIRMLSEKRLPWEIEYCLKNVTHQKESLPKIVERYVQEDDLA